MSADGYSLLYWDQEPIRLRAALVRFRFRVRLLLGLRLTTAGWAYVAGLAALVVVWTKLKGTYLPPLMPEALLALVAAAAIVAAALWRLPDLAVAASIDRRLGLRDRLGTALHLAGGQWPNSGMEQAMVSDALERIGRLRARDAYPLQAQRSTKLMGACLAALLLAQALPIPPLLLSPREREEKALLQRQAARIEPVVKKIEQLSRQSKDAEAKKLARRLKKLARDMLLGKMDKKQALLDLKKMDNELQALEKKAPAPPKKTAAQAAEELRKAGQDHIASKAEQLAQQAARQGNKQAERKLKEVVQQARQAKNGSEVKRAADQLNQQAKALGVKQKVPSDLAAALAQALENKDYDKAIAQAAALQEALEHGDTPLTKEEAQELADQLEQMARGLEGTDLDELAKGLKDAASKLRAGDCKGAAQSIGKG